MAINLKELSKKEELFTGGHRLCAGCGASIIVRQVLFATENPVVVTCATGCLEVASTIYPYTAWRVPWFHNAFENAASTLSGIEACYRSLKKKGKIKKDIKFIAFGGDGASYDIGFQMISGVFERGHDLLYICYDNQAYMNTGIQRSSATPLGAWTTTTPAGKVIPGKRENRKDLTQCVAAHNIPYIAQASPSHWRDLMTKVQKALSIKGPAFMNILSPCPRGWRHGTDESIEIVKLAVETSFWPLYEIEYGKWRLTYKPKEKKPVLEWLKRQGRFKHLLTPENKGIVEEFQKVVDEGWERLLKHCQS